MMEFEDFAVAVGVSQGLAFSQEKEMPIASITVQFPDGDHQLCQYPESFCEFVNRQGEWEYLRCSCGMRPGGEPYTLATADQCISFPDFYKRDVVFGRFGDNMVLFINGEYVGGLIPAEGCLCLHHHDTGLTLLPQPDGTAKGEN